MIVEWFGISGWVAFCALAVWHWRDVAFDLIDGVMTWLDDLYEEPVDPVAQSADRHPAKVRSHVRLIDAGGAR